MSMEETKERCLFENLENKHSFIFIGAFHLEVPLDLVAYRGHRVWGNTRNALINYLEESEPFEKAKNVIFEHENCFPLGEPIVLSYRNFMKKFPPSGFVSYKASSSIDDQVKTYSTECNSLISNIDCENLVIICPSGTVAIIGIYSTNDSSIFEKIGWNSDSFRNWVEKDHYITLREVFLNSAENIYNVIDKLNDNFFTKFEFFKKIAKTGKNNFFNLHDIELGKDVYLVEKSCDCHICPDPLIDVYYIEKKQEENKTFNDKFEIGYLNSCLTTDDYTHVTVLLYLYTSFVAFKWTTDFLNYKSREMMDIIASERNISTNQEMAIRLFRIFCYNLTNESIPIAIRITEDYLVTMEKFWQISRMEQLMFQIDKQVNTIHEMFEFVDEKRKTARTLRIGVAATIVSLISISSSIAGIVSTMDYANKMPHSSRLYFILGGTMGALALYLLALLPWQRFLNRRTKIY